MLLNTMLFVGLLRNIGILIIISCAVVLLWRFSKKIDKQKEPIKKQDCHFKITSPKYSIHENKRFATYSVLMNEKHHVFFIDFPVRFKFYSKDNFKTKVKIIYRVPKDPTVEEIMNKEMVFEGVPKEYKYFITDIIIGKIDIEIELNNHYGEPVIGFELLPNDMCNMVKENKIEIKFPNK